MQKDTALGLIANFLTNEVIVGERSRLSYQTLLGFIERRIADSLTNGSWITVLSLPFWLLSGHISSMKMISLSMLGISTTK